MAGDFAVVEIELLVADDLIGLVALAGDDQQIAVLQILHGGADGRSTVADLDGAGCRRQNLGADGGRVFACADCRR